MSIRSRNSEQQIDPQVQSQAKKIAGVMSNEVKKSGIKLSGEKSQDKVDSVFMAFENKASHVGVWRPNSKN